MVEAMANTHVHVCALRHGGRCVGLRWIDVELANVLVLDNMHIYVPVGMYIQFNFTSVFPA